MYVNHVAYRKKAQAGQPAIGRVVDDLVDDLIFAHNTGIQH